MLDNKDIQTTALELLPAIRGMFAKMGLPQDQIEDATQTAFVRLVEYTLPQWAGNGSLYTFALQSAKRYHLNELAKHGNRTSKRGQFPQESGDWGSDGSEFIAAPGNERQRFEESEWLAKALESLDATERRWVALVAANEGNWAAAGREMGVSKATAMRTRLTIADKMRSID